MRLSWYADTGVAVFSIWQGGTCTGTFRLPMADLPGMIDALQRGPQGSAREAGDPQDTELHGMPGQRGRTGHGAGHASGQYDPGDYGPGDHGGTERREGASHGLEAEPGHSEQGIPAASRQGYSRTAAHGRHEETRAVYPDEGPAGALGGYREEHGGRYRDEPPTGVYHGDPLSEDRDGGRRDRPAHRDDPVPAGYRDDLHDGGHHDDPLPGGYRDDSLPGGYRDESPGGPYRANSLPGGYRTDLPGGHHDDPLSPSHAGEPRGGGRRADLRGGGYPDDPPSGGYPDERRTGGYHDESRGGYAEEPLTARYPAEQPTGDYPTGPSDPASDDPGYPVGGPGYSPARPYVAPLPGAPRGTREGRTGRRRGGGREESDPSADSFRYGRPPAEPEVRGRGR